jgi:hypothetical protein
MVVAGSYGLVSRVVVLREGRIDTESGSSLQPSVGTSHVPDRDVSGFAG